MSRPKIIEDFMRRADYVYPTVEMDDALRKHILFLESKLPPEPEEVWRKDVCTITGGLYLNCAILNISNQPDFHLPEPIIDEILRNREVVRRGIDWEKLFKKCDDQAFHLDQYQKDGIRYLVDEQMKARF